MHEYDYKSNFGFFNTDIDLLEETEEDDELFYEDPLEAPSKTDTDNHVKQAQLYLQQRGYDVPLDGIRSDTCKESIIKYLQFQLGYYGAGCAINGELNSDTVAKMKRFLPLKRDNNPRTQLVKVIQLVLLYAGYDINEENAIDSIFSRALESTIKNYQRDNGIKETGTVNSETFLSLFS